MLNNKVVIVTGGAGLLGKEFVKAIIENNGTAVIADINPGIGEQCKKTLQDELKTDRISFIETDINSAVSVNKMIDSVHHLHGKIDAIVNNAYPRNKNYGKHFFDVQHSDFCENMGLNLGGYFLTSQQIALYFIKQGYGNIINISSIYGVIAPKFEVYEGAGNMTMPVEYSVIKSGLIHLTKYMAKYFKGKKIRVNALSPGGIFDNQNPVFVEKYNNLSLNKGMLDKSDLKGTLVYLLSDLSEFVNGQNIIVDDGYTL